MGLGIPDGDLEIIQAADSYVRVKTIQGLPDLDSQGPTGYFTFIQ